MNTELLKLCGFEAEEIERERPRVDKAFDKLEISPEDVSHAEERIAKFFDIEMMGVRKTLGMWLKEAIDLALAKEEGKKVIYASFPPVTQIVTAGVMATEQLHISAPELTLDIVMGQIFDKINPILEVAEEHGLPPGLGNCSLMQCRLGAMVKGIIPLPDLTIVSGFACDQAPKTDELLHELYGVPVVYVDSNRDATWDEYPEPKMRRIEYLATEIRNAMNKLEEVIGPISEDTYVKGRKEGAKLWFAFQQVQEFMRTDPLPLSQADLSVLFWHVGTGNRTALREGIPIINTLTREVKKRVDEERGVIEKGAPRVAFTLPVFTDPSVVKMIEGVGLAIPVCYAAWLSPRQYTTIKSDKFEMRVAENRIKIGIGQDFRQMAEYFKDMAQYWNVNGLIMAYLFSCRPFAANPVMIKQYVEQELGIPVMLLEYDAYDTRDYSAQQLRTRVETFAEVLRARKAVTVA